MDRFEVQMSEALRKLAADIIPSDELLKEANVCANNIIKLLQQRSNFNVGHVRIAGSTGKKTTINNSDVDCVLFINEKLPPFKEVLEDFEKILELTDSFGIRDVHKTKYSIQFKAMSFDFDILPAANFTLGIQAGGDELIKIQQKRVLAYIKEDPKEYGYLYSSSLADATVQFMTKQNGFVNEMVRIAKFWYKTLYFADYISGAKSCIELIAVCAANEEQNMKNVSYLRSFVRFIGYLQNFDNLNIHFDWNEHEVWDKSRPRVIDPVNPYNNLASNWDRPSIQWVKEYAKETKRRLDILATGRMGGLNQLFEPQPAYLPNMREIFKYNPTKSQWLVGQTNTVSWLPDLKIRNEDFRKDYKLRNLLDILKLYFQISICTARTSNFDENQLQEAVQKVVSKHVYNTEFTWSSAGSEKHEDYDVTFTIPSSNQKAVRISYRL